MSYIEHSSNTMMLLFCRLSTDQQQYTMISHAQHRVNRTNEIISRFLEQNPVIGYIAILLASERDEIQACLHSDVLLLNFILLTYPNSVCEEDAAWLISSLQIELANRNQLVEVQSKGWQNYDDKNPSVPQVLLAFQYYWKESKLS